MRRGIVLAAGLGLAACGGSALEGERETGNARQAIEGGTQETEDQSGHVKLTLTSKGNLLCSGTLLTNNWLVTSRYCVEQSAGGAMVSPGSVQVTMGSQSTGAAAIYPHADATDVGVALVQLPSSFVMNGSTTGYFRQLSTKGTGQLPISQRCYGYGGTWGVLRSATLSTNSSSVQPKWYYVFGGNFGEYATWADSGGGCVDSDGSVLGTMQAPTGSSTNYYATASYFRGWALETMGGVSGHVDSVSSTVQGWAYDRDWSSGSITLHYYFDGPAGSGGIYGGSVTTSVYRGDVNSAFGITGNHGFSISIPSSYQDGYQHSIYVYGIDANGIYNPLIDGRGYTFTLGTPPDPSECPAGKYYCDCSGTCVTITMCNHICDN
jgi:hypothetical protein